MGTMIIGSKLCSLMAAFQLNCPSAQKGRFFEPIFGANLSRFSSTGDLFACLISMRKSNKSN